MPYVQLYFQLNYFSVQFVTNQEKDYEGMETYSKGFEITFLKFNEKTPLNDYSFSLKALNKDLGFNMLKVKNGIEKK